MSSNTLKNKIALITGGSRGIGRAITIKLADHGTDVIINYLRKHDAAEKTAKEVREKGVKVHIIKANIGDPEKIDMMFDEVESKFGKLDILINNAASGVARSIMELDVRGWDWTMDINAKAALLCSQRAVRLMPKGGVIINISSLGSRIVLPSYSAVGISKAALEALTRYLAIELAPNGISVNGIAASAVNTEAIKVYSKGLNHDNKSWQETPAGRMVEPEDIADVVSFLCSNQAAMIRGQIIVVDGGRSIYSPDFPYPTK